MEQFILGMLQEQLGKYIVGFHKEKVNASLLNGKGEITDLSLNCAAINEQLSNIMPFIELDSIHISKVAFQVTSWTNLRKAPILVDIEHITVHISEPLHYLYPRKRRRIRQMTVGEMEDHFLQLATEARINKTAFSNPNNRGGYNLGDRIADNLTLEIKSIYIQFQTWGTFKTRRPGPWTPPTIQILLRNLRYCSVDEFGNEGTPDDHWAHNHKPQPRGQERTLLIFKKVAMEFDFGIRTSDGKLFSLLKGGRGVVPPESVAAAARAKAKPTTTTTPTTTPQKPKRSPAAESPEAAAEVVAALAYASSPVPKPSIPEPALAAATGEANTSAVGVTDDPTDKKDVTALEKDNSSLIETAAISSESASPEPNIDAKPTEKENEAAPANDTANSAKATGDNNTEESNDKMKDPEDDVSPAEHRNNQVIVQMTMKRRIRDGALLALQIDNTLSKVELLIPAEVIPHLVQVALGVQSCFSKDRGFEDPLRSKNDKTDHNDGGARANKKDDKDVKIMNGGNKEEEKNGEVGENREATKQGVTSVSVDNPNSEGTTTADDNGVTNQRAAQTEGDIPAIPPKSEDTTTEATTDAQTFAEAAAAMERVDSVNNLSMTDDILSALEEPIAVDTTETNKLGSSTVSQLQQAVDQSKGFSKSITSMFSRRSIATSTPIKSAAQEKASDAASTPMTPADSKNRPGKDRAIIMLPNGLIIHEKISLSISIERATIRGVYPLDKHIESPSQGTATECSPGETAVFDSEEHPENDDYFQLDSKGAVVEFIWPKANLRMGGYAQASVSHVSIQERVGKKIRTMVSGGVRHDPLNMPIENPNQPPKEVESDAAFPFFQDRAIREDPLDMRRTYPAQAVGLVATLECQTRKKPKPKSSTDEPPPVTITTTSASEDTDDSVSAADAASVSKMPDDQAKAANSTYSKPDDVVSVIKVTNDVGVDSFNIVMACDSWCRALRFFLNEDGGGFDPRWQSGEWAETFTTDMLVHPNSPLVLDDHLQQSKTMFLDENEFVSSDLFNVNAKITNCEVCVPAAIQHNVRSCDIIASIDETLLKVSSELPRIFLTSKVGSTFRDDDTATEIDEVQFPNDISDFSIELQNDEALARAVNKVPVDSNESSLKPKSVFCLEVELMGLSTQIIPVIPFYLPIKPQQLCAPAAMKVSFCFEGEPPENEDSNLIKMILYSSVVVEQISMNCDLDLLAGALSTCVFHFQVVKETVEVAMKLIMPDLPHDTVAVEDTISISNNDGDGDLSSTNTNRIKKTMSGRGVLVHRQFHRSRETGGLKIAFFLKVADYDFSLWRQNVSMYSPLRPSDSVTDVVDRQKLRFPLLKLASLSAKRLECGFEVDFPEDDRRFVAKCSVAEAQLGLCNLDGVAAAGDEGGMWETTVPSAAPNAAGNATNILTEVDGEETALQDNIEVEEAVNSDTGSISGTIIEEKLVEEGEEGVSSTSNSEVGVGKSAAQDTIEVEETMNTETGEISVSIIGEETAENVDQGNTPSPETIQEHCEDPRMVTIFSLGCNIPIEKIFDSKSENASSREQSILLRCEEHFGPYRSRSFAAEMGTGGVVNLHVDHIESVFLLILEALMMPTWSRESITPLFAQQRFPAKSVGALFFSLIPGADGKFPGWLWLAYEVIALALPADLRLLLLRIRMNDTLVTIPTLKSHHLTESRAQKCALMLHHLDLTAWYFSEGDFHRDLLSVVAKDGENWSSCIANESPGVHHKMRSRQSFYALLDNDDASQDAVIKKLVPEFEVNMDYLNATMSVAMDNTLSFQDLDNFQECFLFLHLFAKRCIAIYSHLRGRLIALRNLVNGEIEPLNGEGQTCSIHPINAACAEMEQSVRSAKALLVRMAGVFDSCVDDHSRTLREKDVSLEQLQRQVFLKEKERFAAVAMASSPIAGWLRVGGTHQNGQRVSSTSTLLRYWVVLRMDMIILYTGPGKHKPVDFVALRGAKLRVLAGGKSKWDLKRAFGIVETTGKTRFLVAETTDEYIAWTREMEKVTTYHHSTELFKSTRETDAGNDAATQISSDRDEGSTEIDFGGVGVAGFKQSIQKVAADSSNALISLGSANDNPKDQDPSKANEKAIANSLSEGGVQEAATATTASVDELESTISSQSGSKQGQDQLSANNLSSPQEALSGKSKSRLQLRGTVAGMGSATNRWGSALLSATKQKGKAVADKARRTTISAPSKKEDKNMASGNLQVISERVDGRSWTCSHCTFINTAKEGATDVLICGMCQSPTAVADAEFEEADVQPSDGIVVSGESGEAANATVSGETSTPEPQAATNNTDQAIFRYSQSTDALGSRDRLNSSDSAKASFLRTQSANSFGAYIEEDETGSIVSDLAMDDQSEAARSAGRPSGRGRFSGLGSSLVGSRRGSQGTPDAADKKSWFSRLGSNVSGQDDSDNFLKAQPAMKFKNVAIDPFADFTQVEPPPAVHDALRRLDGQWFALVSVADAPSSASLLDIDEISGDIIPEGSPKTTSAESNFCIKIFCTNDSEEAKKPIREVVQSCSAVLGLHAAFSECVADLVHHPLFHERSYGRTASGEMSTGLTNALGISPLDGVRLSGAFLAGTLEAMDSTTSVDAPYSHAANAVTDFLNASLQCPLPGPALLLLSNLLGISMASHEVWALSDDLLKEAPDKAEPSEGPEPIQNEPQQLELELNEKDTEQLGSDERISKDILTLSAKCVAELMGAEQSGQLAMELASVATARHEAATAAFFEPLLPTHVTEHLQEAMHAALMDVMAQRDEAHAQLASTSVLHAHTLEQERKNAKRLTAKLEFANKLQLQVQKKGGPLFGGLDKAKIRKEQEEKEERTKLEKKQEAMQQDSDAEIVNLCNQLSSEISSRTKAALEVIRLKESRKIERQSEADEKDALKSELTRIKEMLAQEKHKSQAGEREAEKWKQYYAKMSADDKHRKQKDVR